MRKRSSNVAMGALVMAGIGYAVGLLTAPKSGRETRKDIQAAAVRAKREAETTLKELHKELDQLMTEGSKTAKKFSAARKKEYELALKQAEKAKEKTRELLSAIHEGDAEDKDLKKAIDEVSQAIDHVKSFLKK